MESVAVLGIICNAIQLVDFTTELVSKARSIQKSGTVAEQENLLLVGKDLACLSKTLTADLAMLTPTLTENDLAISRLYHKCLEVALEIDTAFADINKEGPRGKRRSFCQALNSVRGAKKLAEMQNRLDLFSQQLQQRTQIRTHEAVTDLHVDVICALKEVIAHSAKEHAATRLSIGSLQRQAEDNAIHLQKAIRNLRLDLERRIIESVSKSGRVGQTEMSQIPVISQREVQPYPSQVQTGGRSAVQIREKPRLRRPAAIDNSKTWRYIAQGDFSGLAQCLEDGADANQMCTYTGTVRQGWTFPRATPLIAALCQKNNVNAMVEVLLEHGADPAGYDSVRIPAYWYSLRTENPEIVKIIIWALSEAQDSLGNPTSMQSRPVAIPDNPLESVAWDVVWDLITSKKSMAKELDARGKSPKTVMRAGCLHLAVLFDNEEALKWLLESRVSPHRCYFFHSSAFSIALRKYKTKFVHTIALSSQVGLHEDIWYCEVHDRTELIFDLVAEHKFDPEEDISQGIIIRNIHLIEGLRHAIRFRWDR
jgi:hypothetical protein